MKSTARSLVCLNGLALALALVCTASQANGIWKWRDKDGRIQVSDRAPPMEVPDKDILQRPGVARAAPAAVEPAASGAEAVPRVDSELEARRKKAQADQASQTQARQAADTERRNAIKAENCRRARNQLAVLESGQRIARPNDKGEREFLDDGARAAELARTRDQVNASCQ